MFIKSLKVSLGYGLLVWVIPFALAFILFPIRNSDRIFFESIMPVALVSTVVVLARIARNKEFLRSWQTGLLWLIISVVLDQAFFTWGPQKISFTDYWKDIGFLYLVIPVITWAVHYKSVVIEKSLSEKPDFVVPNKLDASEGLVVPQDGDAVK